MENCLLYPLLFVCAWQLAKGGLDLIVDTNTCTDYHDMEDITEAYVTYRGAILNVEECYIKFLNWDAFQKTICIKPEQLQLDCSTKVEFHRHFISEYNEPERRFICGNLSYDEWCGGVRTTYLYIVFRTNGRRSGDHIKLHVYLKELSKEDDIWESSAAEHSSQLLIYMLVSIFVIVTVVICLIVCVLKRNRQRAAPRTPYVYHTTSGQVDLQTDAAPMQPMYQPQQPHLQPPAGHYQWHPTQSAYPVSAEQSMSLVTSNQRPLQQTTPSAPPSRSEELPPSYESVVS